MQTQQVKGLENSLLYVAKSTAATKSSSGTFDQLLQTMQQPEKSSAAMGNLSSGQTNNAGKVSETKDISEEETSVLKEQTETTQAEETPFSAADDLDKVKELLDQVEDLVKDALDLDEDELEQLMEQMGLTMLDLLQPQQLQQLVLAANGEQSAVALVTDEQLFGTVQELTEQVQDLIQDFGIQIEELTPEVLQTEFGAVLEQTEDLTEEVVLEQEEPKSEEMVESAGAGEKSTTIEFKAEVEQKTDSETSQEDSHGTETENDTFAAQFTQNLQKAAEAVSESSEEVDAAQRIREIADQILEKVKVSVSADTTSLEIVLTPEELGKVNLTISEQDGILKAKFVAESTAAKEAIESNLIQFKEMLNEQGLKVETIEVMVGNFEFNKDGQAGQSSAQEEKKNGKHRFIRDDSIGEAAEETDLRMQHFIDGGESTVNYMA